jgi:hypothetical protein
MISFRKNPWNRLGTVFIIPRKKVLISRHSEVYRRVNFEARNETELQEQIWFTKNPTPANRIESVLLSAKCFGTEFREICFYLLLHKTEFRVVVFSAECFRTEFREFVSIFLPGYNIRSIFPLRNGSARNSESFQFCRTARIPPEQTFCSVYSVFCV